MRIEATIPDPLAEVIQDLAERLGVTRSQIVDEALGLFLKAATEARKGHKLAIIDSGTQKPVCEMVIPSLAQLEWTRHVERITVSAADMRKVAASLKRPPAPTPALRRLLGGSKKR